MDWPTYRNFRSVELERLLRLKRRSLSHGHHWQASDAGREAMRIRTLQRVLANWRSERPAPDGDCCD